MRFTQHPSNNFVLAAPPGVPIEECGALPVTRLKYSNGVNSFLSFWQPTAEQLALLNAGHPVVLEVQGTLHPPVLVAVAGDGTFQGLGHGL
ncbi:MAG TPA: hypothetical protein VN755_07585 [Steroidobacteraceae bacterium]|nr:hypothetical protein [Steroidobacteraceae bacterium]